MALVVNTTRKRHFENIISLRKLKENGRNELYSGKALRAAFYSEGRLYTLTLLGFLTPGSNNHKGHP